MQQHEVGQYGKRTHVLHVFCSLAQIEFTAAIAHECTKANMPFIRNNAKRR